LDARAQISSSLSLHRVLMSRVSDLDAPVAAPAPHSRLAFALSVGVDAAVAVGAYFAAYRLRFDGTAPETFLIRAWVAAAWLVTGQLVALALWKVYSVRPIVDWLVRVTLAVATGTVAAVVFMREAVGFVGVSRMTFLIDAVLLSIGAAGWRCFWALRARTRSATSPTADDDLVDISDELTDRKSVV